MNIIYITSNGRSGSTILEVLLSSAKNTFTLGEVQLLDLELKFNAKCGSNERISESIYWKKIIQQLPLEDNNARISEFRKSNPLTKSHSGKVIRTNYLLAMLGIKKFKKFEESYTELNLELFKKCKEQAELVTNENIENLIDASKDPYRLFYLQKSKKINIKAVHLVKHPCSFVYSNIKHLDKEKRLLRIIKMSFRWVIENLIISFVCKQNPNSILVSYYDLTNKTEESINSIEKKLEVNFSGYSLENFRQIKNYGISGNLSRFRGDQISYDNKWQRELTNTHKFLIKLITICLSPRLYKLAKGSRKKKL